MDTQPKSCQILTVRFPLFVSHSVKRRSFKCRKLFHGEHIPTLPRRPDALVKEEQLISRKVTFYFQLNQYCYTAHIYMYMCIYVYIYIYIYIQYIYMCVCVYIYAYNNIYRVKVDFKRLLHLVYAITAVIVCKRVYLSFSIFVLF